MYERMLNKSQEPTAAQMTAYCGEMAALFTLLNGWLSESYGTEQKITFPYGNQYGWGISHRKRKKLVCNIFAEDNAFTVMLRLTNQQYAAVYGRLKKYTQDYIDNKYPCGEGGWIHYRVSRKEQLEDIQTLLAIKCAAT